MTRGSVGCQVHPVTDDACPEKIPGLQNDILKISFLLHLVGYFVSARIQI